MSFCIGGYYKAVVGEGTRGYISKAVVTAVVPSSTVLSDAAISMRYRVPLSAE